LRVQSEAARAAVRANFKAANAEALAGYSGEQAALYSKLKLAGLDRAPVHLAVFCDDETPKGAGLGARTMPQTRRYSVVGAITQFWLLARAHGLGVGWVSILDPDELARDLDAPKGWAFVGYLCIGYPEEESLTPELEQAGWEMRAASLPMELR
jgi:5,6-dimethylbenzimidazole synthase